MGSLHTKLFTDNSTSCKNSVIGNNFTVTNASTFTTGFYKNSNAVTITSGTNTRIDKSDIVSKEGTIIVMFKPNGWSLSGTSMSGGSYNSVFYRDNLVVPLMTWSVQNGIGIRYLFHDGVNPTRVIDSNTQTINDGQWYAASVTWSTANNELKSYLDGVCIATLNTTVALTGSSSTYYSLGRRAGLNDQWLSGDADGMTIYNRVLSASEIKQAMNIKRNGLSDNIE